MLGDGLPETAVMFVLCWAACRWRWLRSVVGGCCRGGRREGDKQYPVNRMTPEPRGCRFRNQRRERIVRLCDALRQSGGEAIGVIVRGP